MKVIPLSITCFCFMLSGSGFLRAASLEFESDSEAFTELHLQTSGNFENAAVWLESVKNLDLRSRLTGTLGIGWAKKDLESAIAWANALPDTPVKVEETKNADGSRTSAYLTSMKRSAMHGITMGLVQQSWAMNGGNSDLTPTREFVASISDPSIRQDCHDLLTGDYARGR